MKKRIVLYGGTFDPPHIGHGIVARWVANQKDICDEVWIVPTPQNPNKTRKATDLSTRIRMLLDMFTNNCNSSKIRISAVAQQAPSSRTIDIIKYLGHLYPDVEFKPLIGSDCLTEINTWKDSETLLSDYGAVIYPRGEDKLVELYSAAFPKVDIISSPCPTTNISSSMIRDLIKNHKSVHFLITPEVYRIIISQNLYSV